MRPRLTSTPSLLAMAAMLAAVPMAARAQSFNATGTIVAGAGTILTSPGNTSVSANSSNLVINWAPTDTATGGGPINFQSAGTTANFANGDSTALNVLNRILPTDPSRPIVFNGTVKSQLIDLATGVASRGGTLFFYSPGGILVSSTGVFDVGNLVLTASDLNFDPSLGSFGTAGTYSFLPANAGSLVQVQKGAQITAGPGSAYVALIAPKVINSGTINVDGSAVIVAADASTITFRPNGLFDIQIDQGTSAAGEVVTNDGSITGPVGAINAAHRVYMVAVPRNDAITMAIKGGSSLGFDVAGAADVVGNAIVLSAGYGISGGVIDDTRAALGGTVPAALTIGAITATSQVTGKATGQVSLTVDSGNTASFASDLTLAGVRDPATGSDDAAFISVSGVGSTLDIKNNLQLTALDAGQVASTLTTDSGNAAVTVDQGKLTVGGAASITSARVATVAVDVVAGKASLAASGGAIVDIGTDLSIYANAVGKTVSDASSSGPNRAIGGTTQLSFDGGSTVRVGRDLLLDSTGIGGSVTLGGLAGSDGTGGNALVQGGLNGGSLSVSGATTLDAGGFGGQGLSCVSCTVEGGTATGGSASIIAAKGASFTLNGFVGVDASALGGAAALGDGKDGGAALGGTALVRSDGGQITMAQALSVRAEGSGGAGSNVDTVASGVPSSGGTGGKGTGGMAAISAGDAASLGGGGLISVSGDTLVSTVGTGGAGANGGAGVGGTTSVSARNGTVSGSALVVLADGVGGNSYNAGLGGSGQGTSADVIAYSALEGAGKITFSSTNVSAQGDGGLGSSPQFVTGPGSTGGDGTGGAVRVLAEAGNGALALGETSLNANGTGGSGGDGFVSGSASSIGENGGNGGVGRGGIAQIGVVSGLETGALNTGKADLAALSVSARGSGGAGGLPSTAALAPGNYGTGGAGYGGGAALIAEGGTVTLSAAGLFDAGGIGGVSGLGGVAGDGFVGDAGGLPTPYGVRLDVLSRAGQPAQKGILVATDLTFLAAAETGKGGTSGNSTILGHPLVWGMNGGTINAANVSFLATGIPATGAPPSDIALVNGTATLTGDLSFVTPGVLSATLDGADVSAANVTMTATDWVEGLVPSGTPGTLLGSSSVTLTTGNDLFGHFSVNSGSALSLIAAGLVRLDNLTAVGDIGVNAGTTVSLGNVKSGGGVGIAAPGNVTVGTVSAGLDAALNSGAALVTGGVSAGQKIRLDGAASILAGGAIQAGDSVLLNSDGAISTAAISAGLVSPSALSTATYNLTVLGRGGMTLGNVAAKGDVALLSPNAISSGSITGKEVAVLGAGNQSLGGITATGRVLLADYEMVGFGGDPLGAYDLAGVFAAAPLATSGVITLSGAANVGQLTAVTINSIALQDVTATAATPANGSVNLQAGAALGTGAIVAGDRIDLQSGTTMTVASASAGAQLAVTAGGALTAGALSAVSALTVNGSDAVTATGMSGQSVLATAAKSLSAGTVRATGGPVTLTATDALSALPITATGTITLTSTAASVSVGNLASSSGAVSLTAKTSGSAGTVTAQTGIAIAAGSDLTLASASTATGDVTLGAGAALTSGNVTATTGLVLANAGTSALLGDITAAGTISGSGIQVTAGTTLTAGNAITSAGTVDLSSTGTLTAGNLSGDAGVNVTGLAGVTVGSVLAPNGAALLTATNDLVAGSITTGAQISLTSTSGGVKAGALTSVDSSITATSAGAMDIVSATAANLVTFNSGGVLSAGAVAGVNGVSITGLGAVTTAVLTSDVGNVVVTASGDLATGAVIAAGFVTLTSSGGGLSAGNVRANGGTVTLRARNAASAGNVGASGGVLASTGGNLNLLSAISDTGDVNLGVGGGVVTGDLTATTGRVLVSANGSAALGNLAAAGLAGGLGLRVRAGTTLSAGNAVVTAGELRLVSGGAMAAGNLTANAGLLTVSSGGTLSAGALAGSAGITLTAAGDTTLTGDANSSGGDITMDVTGALNAKAITATVGLVDIKTTSSATTGAIKAGTSLTMTSGGALATGDLSATAITLNAATTLGAGKIAAGSGDISLTSTGDMTLGDVTGLGAVTAGTTTGAITANSVSAGGALQLVAGGDLSAGPLSAGGAISASGRNVSLGNVDGSTVGLSSGGTLTVGNVRALANAISITANNAITAGTLDARTTVLLRSSLGSITTGAITTDGSITVVAPGDVRLGDLFADRGSIQIGVTNGSLTTGSMGTNVFVAAVASGNLDLGAVSARDMVLLAGGSTRAASLAAQGGRILIASNSLGTAGGSIGQFNIDAVFAQPLVASGGALTVTGATSSNTFTAAVAGDVTTGSVAASSSIFVDAGGTARLGGVWQSPSIQLRANDIDLPAGAGLNAGLSGTITLASRNPAGMRIGDGLDGSVVPTSGFSLDNAEWRRINSGSFSVIAPDVAGPVDILIGKLDVTGPDAGSTIDDPLGKVSFSTVPPSGNASAGTIRVVGALKTLGFRSTNALVFNTRLFQLASDTGSITMLGTGGAPSGTLQINARDIHVAATSLLGPLAADPFFAGVEPALDTVSAGGSGPVLLAGALDFSVGRSLYIQRTGSGFDPLGFEEPLGGLNITQGGTRPIAVIINGTFRTATGVISGPAAWQEFKKGDFNFAGFTPDSRVNGCLLIAAACSVRIEPDPGIRTVIEWAEKPKLDDTPYDPENPAPQSRDAIMPPQLLLPIRPDALTGQVDEPIAGSGNPALSAGSGAEGVQP